MGFNPADFKAVVDEAKVMSKPELESYYIKDINKRHLSCGEKIGLTFAILVFILMFVLIGVTIAETSVNGRVSDALVETSLEVCPSLGEGYSFSQRIVESSDLTDRIICTKYNSKG